MKDHIQDLINQATQIVRENNNVYKFKKISQSTDTAYSIRAQNTSGDVRSFITDLNSFPPMDWERAFYGQGWANVVVQPSRLIGPLTILAIPNASITPGDTAYSQRSFSGTGSSLRLKPFESFGEIFIPGLGVRQYSPTPHTPTSPYGISSSRNEIQQYFLSLDNERKYRMRWEGGNFLDWWEQRASRASSPTSTTASPSVSYSEPGVVQAFEQKIPYRYDIGYHEFIKLMKDSVDPASSTPAPILPSETIIEEYENMTGNQVENIYQLGKNSILQFRDYDRNIMQEALQRLENALAVTEDYETAQAAADAVDVDAKERANTLKKKIDEVSGLFGGFLSGATKANQNINNQGTYKQ
jgi:hypothetical protein